MDGNEEICVFGAYVSGFNVWVFFSRKMVKSCLKGFKGANFLSIVKKQDARCFYAL